MAVADDISWDNHIMRQIITAEYPEDPLTILGERKFDQYQPSLEIDAGSPIQEFFRNTTVLVTGGTGFLGVVLTEKLLRSCPHMNHLYVLVRGKNDMSSEERYQQVLQDKVNKSVA